MITWGHLRAYLAFCLNESPTTAAKGKVEEMKYAAFLVLGNFFLVGFGVLVGLVFLFGWAFFLGARNYRGK